MRRVFGTAIYLRCTHGPLDDLSQQAVQPCWLRSCPTPVIQDGGRNSLHKLAGRSSQSWLSRLTMTVTRWLKTRNLSRAVCSLGDKRAPPRWSHYKRPFGSFTEAAHRK